LDKLEQLRSLFAEMNRAVIAYSGGISSTLVAKVRFDVLGDRALSVTDIFFNSAIAEVVFSNAGGI
jgi:uncharacterized protein